MRTSVQRSLVSIHFQLLLLQNYVALNFTAVTKILKKFEKKFEITIRNEYIGAIVELPFYKCDSLGELVEETERQFNALAGMSNPASPMKQPAGGVMSPPQHAHAAAAAAYPIGAMQGSHQPPPSTQHPSSMPPPPPRPPMASPNNGICVEPVVPPPSLQTGKGAGAHAQQQACLPQVS